GAVLECGVARSAESVVDPAGSTRHSGSPHRRTRRARRVGAARARRAAGSAPDGQRREAAPGGARRRPQQPGRGSRSYLQRWQRWRCSRAHRARGGGEEIAFDQARVETQAEATPLEDVQVEQALALEGCSAYARRRRVSAPGAYSTRYLSPKARSFVAPARLRLAQIDSAAPYLFRISL